MKPVWPLLLLAWCLCAPAHPRELPDYIRYTEDSTSARLEVAIRRFTLPSGQQVDLVGAVHIADAPYYQELNQRFATYDAVLFELVGDPARLTSAPPAAQTEFLKKGSGAIGFMQQAASKYLDLTFQLGAIDYSGKNMVHADMSMEQFEALQAARGESMATLFARAMQAQASGALDSSANEFDTFGLLRILVSPDSAAAFKKALAKTFDQMESVTAAIEGPQGSAILSARNEVAVTKLKAVLAHKAQRHVAVFYGGAHMPGIEAQIIEQLQARPAGEEWLAAWTMKKIVRAPAPQAKSPATN